MTGKFKRTAGIFIFSLFLNVAFSQSNTTYSVTDLTYQNTSWVAETGASVICQPERNSFGYIFISEGRMINAINQNGTILWQKQVSEKISPFLTSIPGDLFFAVFSNSKLTLINSSFLYIWQRDCNFKIEEKPLLGLDGRVFVRGKDNLASYSIKGQLKWSMELKNQNVNLPLTEFNDGSLLLFLNEDAGKKSIASLADSQPFTEDQFSKNSQSSILKTSLNQEESSNDKECKALRISPFGDILEEITFNSNPCEICSTKSGIVISFEDGRCSLIAVKNRQVCEVWRFSNYKSPSKLYALKNEKDLLLINGNPSTINLISLSDGKLKSKSTYTNLSPSQNLSYIDETSGGIVLFFTDNAICISPSLKIQWQAVYNKKKNFRYAFSTDYGYLVMCTDDWVVEAFRMQQSFQKSKYTYKTKSLRPYTLKFKKSSPLYPLEMNYFRQNYDSILSFYREENSPIEFQKFDSSATRDDRLSTSNSRADRINEEIFYVDLNSQFTDFVLAYQTGHEYSASQLYMKEDMNEASAVLDLLSQSGTFSNWSDLSYLMKEVDDPTILLMLVKAAGIIAYDPDGKMLSTLERISHSWPDKKDELFYKSICDSVYEICAFMGRPTFFETGEKILTYLLSKPFLSGIKSYSRETLKKVITLKL